MDSLAHSGSQKTLVRELGGQWGVGMGRQANAREMEGGGGGEETREEGEEERRKKRSDQEESSPRP